MILPTKMRLVPNQSTSVTMIAVGNRNETFTATEKQDPYGLSTKSTEIVLNVQKERSGDKVQPVTRLRSERGIVTAAKFNMIFPWTGSTIITTSKTSVLWYLHGHPNTVSGGCNWIERGVMECILNEPMKLLLENLFDTAIYIHNNMKVAVETDMPDQVVQFGKQSNLNQIFKSQGW